MFFKENKRQECGTNCAMWRLRSPIGEKEKNKQKIRSPHFSVAYYVILFLV